MEKLEAVEVPISEIKPYAKNPRDNEATVQKLMDLIKRVGFNQPLLLTRDNEIVKGHARYEACKRLGFKSIPCVYTDNTEDLVKFDRIADNKVHELTTWDYDELMHEVDMLKTDYDMLSLGVYTDKDFDFVDQGFIADDYENEEDEDSFESKRERYLQLLAEMEKSDDETPVFATTSDIDNAKWEQNEIPKKKRELIPIKCDGCGGTIYVDKTKVFNDIWVED